MEIIVEIYSVLASKSACVTRYTFLTVLFTHTPSQLLWEASSHMLQLMREDCSYIYPPLSIARYSFTQLSELEQCRVIKVVQGFNTTAQDSNPGDLSRESEALHLSHCIYKQIQSITFWQTTIELLLINLKNDQRCCFDICH